MNKRQEDALRSKFDLFVVQVGSEWQACDGSGRDGFVLATAPTRDRAVEMAYLKYAAKLVRSADRRAALPDRNKEQV